MKPLAFDIYCGLGGWTEGLLAEGYSVIGFDIEAHDYGDGKRYPAQLVIQDALTIHGRQFKDAALIVASPPCQEYSYMAMPWSRAKAIAAEYRSGARDVKKLTALFDACFHIQREAMEAAGHFIPMVVENVRGAQPWVGRARWNFGSFYLWGDVPALMPITQPRKKGRSNFHVHEQGGSSPAFNGAEHEANVRRHDAEKWNPDGTDHPPGSWFKIADSKNRGARTEGFKTAGMNWSDPATYGKNVTGHPGRNRGVSFTDIAGRQAEGIKTVGHVNKRDGHAYTRHLTNQAESEGVKGFTPNGEPIGRNQGPRQHGSKSNARKAASAQIAKIPFALARWIARVYKPK